MFARSRYKAIYVHGYYADEGEDTTTEQILLVVKNLSLAICDFMIGYWWIMLQLAVEMSKVHIRRVTKRVDKVLNSKDPLDNWEGEDGIWVSKIEKPSVRLVRRILPALSDGFGFSVFCIVVALTLHVCCLTYELYAQPPAMWLQSERRSQMYWDVGLVVFLSTMVVVLTYSIAKVSGECNMLMNSLVKLCHRSDRQLVVSWQKELERIKPLHEALEMTNGGLGPGFIIPYISAKLSLKTLLSFMFGLLMFLIEGVPLLMGNPAVNDYQIGADKRCPFSWNAVEGKCFKLFGMAEHDLNTWHGAEAVCKLYGAHLMSIETQGQQDAVAALLRMSAVPSKQAVWIGLKRQSSGGKEMTWINNSSSHFEHWAKDEPDLPAEGDGDCDLGFTWEATRDNCGFISRSSGCASRKH